MSSSLKPLGSFAPGINNRLEPQELDTKQADGTPATYLYGADNVDINKRGNLKRRRGYTQTLSGSAHSVWSDGSEAYVVIDDVLTGLFDTQTGFARTSVRTGMARQPVSYARGADGDVYWSNTFDIRRISAGVDRPIATPVLANAPQATIVAGALRAGHYILAMAPFTVDGEGPATDPQHFQLADNQGLAFTSPVPVNVYLTAPNGSFLHFQGSGTSFQLLTQSDSGHVCQTLNRDVMPAGQIVRFYNGRMLVASGNSLYVSDPYNYGLYDPFGSFFPFAANIDVVEPTTNGVYICADQTYWIGDLFAGDLIEVLNYGGVPGSSGRNQDTDEVYWNSSRGLIIADKNMSVKAVQNDVIQFGDAASGATYFREQDGMRQLVASRAGVGVNTALATSFMRGQVLRRSDNQ